MVATDPNIGRLLRDRYKLLRLLGQGSMGRVYKADDEALGDVPVAIKFLSQTLLNNRMRVRFEREAKTCAQLGQRSIHIVRVTDYGVDEDNIPFYVMEYLQGDGLIEIIRQQPLSLPRFLNFARQICLGLQCAHQGIRIDGEVYPIVHRDIKPSNILVSRDESLGELVKILDFGIAKVVQSESSHTGCFMGTLAYASPEQMEGHELDARSDIYSLGVMLFQMLTGRLPLHANTHSFGGWYKAHQFHTPKSLEEANPEVKVPRALENLVMSCLSKKVGDRPQNIAEILRALEPLEERYGMGRKLAQRIGVSLAKVPINAEVRPDTKTSGHLSPEEACQQAHWPSKMPRAEIVFSRPLSCQAGAVPTLWIMLPNAEIERRRVCTRYNQFLFMEAPHPMVLWLTVLYNRQHGPRWLPCYLDLKTSQGRQMARLLSQDGQYRLLFFAQDNPHAPTLIQSTTIAPAQCQLLQEWAAIGQVSQGTANPSLAKDYLRGALENIKPKILLKLEGIYTDGIDLSA